MEKNAYVAAQDQNINVMKYDSYRDGDRDSDDDSYRFFEREVEGDQPRKR